MNVSEYFFSQDEPQIPSPQVVTICSWRNCVCCFQDVATPISICQQSYFSYAISIYHRRKPLNSKFSINPKTQACFLFLGTKEQIPRNSYFWTFHLNICSDWSISPNSILFPFHPFVAIYNPPLNIQDYLFYLKNQISRVSYRYRVLNEYCTDMLGSKF